MSDDAVSDVVGNILLVGITVALMSGMSVAVMSVGGPPDILHADLAVDLLRGGAAWGDGDEGVRLRHLGGEPVPAGVEVLLDVDGAAAVYAPDDQGFADGALRIGEAWVLTTTLAEGEQVSVAVIDPGRNAIVAASGVQTAGGGSGGGSGGGGAFTYVDAGTATTGTLSDLADAQDADDGGAAATLTEASSAGTPTTPTLSAGTVTSSSGATSPGNVLASDDARAGFVAAGDQVEVEGFGIPAGASVTQVVVGFEALRPGGGGSNAQLTLSYTVSGTPGATSLSATVSGAGDTAYTTDVTADRAWTEQDVADLHLVLVRDSADAGFRDADVDHVFVQVTYSIPVTDLEATFDFAGVPAGATQTLQLRYSTGGDSFDLQVWDGVAAAWTSRGTLDSAAAATFTHVLTADEYDGGAPRLRFLDLDSGTVAGTLSIDYARVETT